MRLLARGPGARNNRTKNGGQTGWHSAGEAVQFIINIKKTTCIRFAKCIKRYLVILRYSPGLSAEQGATVANGAVLCEIKDADG